MKVISYYFKICLKVMIYLSNFLKKKTSIKNVQYLNVFLIEKNKPIRNMKIIIFNFTSKCVPKKK